MIGRPSGPVAPSAPRSQAGGASKKPEYTIYGRSGREGQREAPKRTKKEPKASGGEKPPEAGDRAEAARVAAVVYRSRPSLRDRIRAEPLQPPGAAGAADFAIGSRIAGASVPGCDGS